jgi:hypothetical protein
MQTAAYISMSRAGWKECDQRRTRISEICKLLGKFEPNNNLVEHRATGSDFDAESCGEGGNDPQQTT